MGTDLTATSRALACPCCGAALRQGAPWCTLCYADLRSPVAPSLPAPVVAPAAAYGLPAADPLTAPLLDVLLPAEHQVPAPVEVGAEPTWPCTRCGTATPMSSTACPQCGAGFLDAERQAGAPTLVLPVVGDLLAMSRSRRMLLALAAVLTLCLPLALVTLLLTHSPPANVPSGTTRVTTSP